MIIQLAPKHLEVVKEILGELARQAFVFGSRAKGTAKPLSDIDLVIMVDVPRDQFIELKSKFEDSNLPMKVDIALWSQLDESFRAHIQPDLIQLASC